MASPFSIFRKYSTGAMIVLVILSMLVFTFDSLFSAENTNLWLLGLLLGGTVFGIAGIKQGRWLQWGIGGAIFGMALGFVMPYFSSPTGIMTSMGEIDGEEIIELQEQRQVANNVMYGVADAAMPEGLPDQFRQQYVSQIARLFGFRSSNPQEDVLFGRLMREEADRLGLSSGTAVVSEYLNDASNGELTASELVELRERLMFKGKKLDDEQLQEILGNELNAQLAYNLTAPMFTSYPAPPHVYWDYFKRFNVTQSLKLIPMETDAFLDSVGEPSETQIGELFEQYKNNYRNTPLLGDPGFRQYLRARIAYFELPAAEAKKQIAAVTDEEVKTWYDENQTDPLIETTVFEDDEEEAAEDATETPEGSDDKPANESTEDSQPADETKESESKPTEKPAAEEKPATPEKTPAKTEEPKEVPEKTAVPKAETPAEEKPAEEPAQVDDPAANDCGYQEEPSEPQASEPKPPAKETPAPQETPAADATPATAEPQEETPAPASEESSADEKPTQPLVIPAAPKEETTGSSDEPQQPKFRKVIKPLDDDLKSVIRTRLENQRVEAFIDEKMTEAVNFMQGLSIERATKRFEVEDADAVKDLEEIDRPQKIRELMADYDADLLKQMQEYAKDNSLSLSQTPMLDLGEMVDTDDYPVAKAYEPTANPTMQSQQPMLGALLFSDLGQDPSVMGGQLFGVARRVRDDPLSGGPASHYVAVLSDYSEGHVPTLDEDGIREKVVLTWKRLEARKKLEERANEVIAEINKGLSTEPAEGEEAKSMAELVDEMTVTGQDGDNKLVVRPTTSFTWMRTSTAPQMQLQQRPEITLSAIMFSDEKGGVVGGVRNEFMEQIFNKMDQDEIALVPDATKGTYYIAQVINRYPNREIGMDGLREEFAEAGKTSFAQNPILDVMRERLGPPVFNQWRRDVWKRYDVELNETP